MSKQIVEAWEKSFPDNDDEDNEPIDADYSTNITDNRNNGPKEGSSFDAFSRILSRSLKEDDASQHASSPQCQNTTINTRSDSPDENIAEESESYGESQKAESDAPEIMANRSEITFERQEEDHANEHDNESHQEGEDIKAIPEIKPVHDLDIDLEEEELVWSSPMPSEVFIIDDEELDSKAVAFSSSEAAISENVRIDVSESPSVSPVLQASRKRPSANPNILPKVVQALTRATVAKVHSLEITTPSKMDNSPHSWQPTWDLSPNAQLESRASVEEGSTGTASSFMNPSAALHHAELELCRRLDEEYEQAIEDREVSWKARYTSIRQSALLSSILMVLYLVLGCWFYTNHTTWDITDSLLFTVYSVTTVGYGNHVIPKTVSFQLFTICYILVGIALITVLAAHMYQFIVLEATKVQFQRDTAELARRSAAANAAMAAEVNDYNNQHANNLSMTGSNHSMDTSIAMSEPNMRARFMAQLHAQIIHDRPRAERVIDSLIVFFERTKNFLRDTHTGQILSVFLPFCGLILFGAIVVGVIEEWTMVESIYWAVVTLTTVGFGDYHPTQTSSTWFCIFYLPCSLFFMSFFLAQVAQSYIKLHAVHVQRLEHRMRARIQRAREEMVMVGQRSQSTSDHTSKLKFQVFSRSPPIVPFPVNEEPKQEIETNTPEERATRRGFLRNGALRGVSPKKRRGLQGVTPQNVALGFEFLPPDDDANEQEEGQSPQNIHELPEHSNFTSLNSSIKSSLVGKRHREKVVNNSSNHMMADVFNNKNQKGKHAHVFKTMKAVLRSMKKPLKKKTKGSSTDIRGPNSDFDLNFKMVGDKLSNTSAGTTEVISSLSHHGVNSGGNSKPSFALRMLVQERFAQIISAEVAGFQSEVVIRENTLSVTIPSLKDTAEKWMIPRRARKAFRSVAFQALFYVGERDLITKGADTLLNLSPFEFHGLFSPVLAAMGDGETMADWLASTDVMADVELCIIAPNAINCLAEAQHEHEII